MDTRDRLTRRYAKAVADFNAASAKHNARDDASRHAHTLACGRVDRACRALDAIGIVVPAHHELKHQSRGWMQLHD